MVRGGTSTVPTVRGSMTRTRGARGATAGGTRWYEYGTYRSRVDDAYEEYEGCDGGWFARIKVLSGVRAVRAGGEVPPGTRTSMNICFIG